MKLIIENWRKLIKESSATDTLDDILSAAHASGRPIDDNFQDSLSMEESPEQDFVSIVANQLASQGLFSTWAEYKSYLGTDEESLAKQKNTDDFQTIIQTSIALFTGGNVESVRDPSNFNKDKSKATGHLADTLRNLGRESDKAGDVETSLGEYQVANTLISAMAQGSIRSSNNIQSIYRGIMLPQDVASELKVGMMFGRDLSSWTADEEQARSFIYVGPDEHSTKIRCLLMIRRPKTGAPVFSFSVYPDEQEVIRKGQVRIKEIHKPKSGLFIICEEV